jgi:SAM-dependent methyltransferase
MPSLIRDSKGRIETESAPMRALRRIGRDDLAWPLRRLHVPVSPDALVLEIGSGGNPFPRANVLLDAYEATRERHYEPLVQDRPTVLGLMENMPFRDGAFDFVIACHVVEHSLDVVACLRELQRVARSGYIETPDAFFERINPYQDHRFELTVRGDLLKIRPKQAWRHDPEVVELYEAQVQPSRHWPEQFRKNPFAFHMRHFWSAEDGGIRYELLGPESKVPIRGPGEEIARAAAPRPSLRQKVIRGVRAALSQSRRNRQIDLASLLRCPACHASLERAHPQFECRSCGATYSSPSPGFVRLTSTG